MEPYNAVSDKAFPLIVQGSLPVLVEESLLFQYDDKMYDCDRI